MAQGRKTGGGSRKGVPNRLSSEVKGMVLAALDQAGGVAYLAEQARASPAAFLALVGRIMPIEQRQIDDDGKAVDTKPSFVWVVQK